MQVQEMDELSIGSSRPSSKSSSSQSLDLDHDGIGFRVEG
jgi:hypothetical protein